MNSEKIIDIYNFWNVFYLKISMMIRNNNYNCDLKKIKHQTTVIRQIKLDLAWDSELHNNVSRHRNGFCLGFFQINKILLYKNQATLKHLS